MYNPNDPNLASTAAGLSFRRHNRAIALSPEIIESGGVFATPGLRDGLIPSLGESVSEAGVLKRRLQAQLSLREGRIGPASSRRLIEAYKNRGIEATAVSAKDPQHLREVLKQTAAQRAWGRATGLNPVAYDPSEASTTVIRHESIHSAHLAAPDHPFWKKELAKTPSFRNTLKAHTNSLFARDPSGALAIAEEADVPVSEVLSMSAEVMWEQYKSLYQTAPSKAVVKLSVASERLAFSYEENRLFLLRARAAGVRTLDQARDELRRTRTARLSSKAMMSSSSAPVAAKAAAVVTAVETVEAHKPLIEGLRHGGWAARLRKWLTSFGSGWQGPGAEMLTAHGSGGASVEELARNEEFWRIKRGGALSYQGVHPDAMLGPGEALIAVHKKTGAMRVQQSSMGLSDSQVIESASPRLKQAFRELGRKYPTVETARDIGRAVMKSGETKSAAGLVSKYAVRIGKSL